MISRRSLADEIDIIDQAIADLNSSKKDCFDAYRAQLGDAGIAKENIKLELDATKAAIKRRRAVLKDENAVEEKDALVDEIFSEITASIRAPRTRVENVDKFAPIDRDPHSQAVDGGQPYPSSDAGGAKREADQGLVGHADALSDLLSTKSEQSAEDFSSPAPTSSQAGDSAGEGVLPLSPASHSNEAIPQFLRRGAAA